MADNHVIKLNTANEDTSYKELKTKATSALTKTGASFSWSSINDNSIIKASHYVELQNALNAAYNKLIIETSGNSSYTSNSATRINHYSYTTASDSVKSNDSVDYSGWNSRICVCYSRG